VFDPLRSQRRRRAQPKLGRKKVEHLQYYLAHLSRDKMQSHAKQIQHKDLKPDEAMVVIDWKMRFLMACFREAQVEYFGKKGISWQGAMVVRHLTLVEQAARAAQERGGASGAAAAAATAAAAASPSEAEYVVEFIDCIMSDKTQDGFASHALLVAALKQLHTTHEHIKGVHLWTDGAKNYTGVAFFVGLINMEALTGIRILSHTITEAGCGKTMLDGHFAIAAGHVNRVIDKERVDVVSGSTLHEALSTGGGVSRSTALLAEPLRNAAPVVKAPSSWRLTKWSCRELQYCRCSTFFRVRPSSFDHLRT
jgi:uncharacterized membrane protein YgdD (TMEM256/DUF423 family)